jgi:type II secretion system protein J
MKSWIANCRVDRAGRRRSAFTLVEMLAALTIGALLVVSAVSATRALAGTRQSVDRRVERSEAARAAIDAIVSELRNVRRDPVADEPVVVGTANDAGEMGDRIDLLVLSEVRARADGPESDQYETSFFLGRPAGQSRTALLHRRDHALDDRPRDGGIVTVVAERIVTLKFSYYAENRWQEEWPPLSPTPPEAVRVTVTAIDNEQGARGGALETTTLSTVVPIHVDLPPSKNPKREQAEERPQGGPKR